jgi:hypothetical protein
MVRGRLLAPFVPAFGVYLVLAEVCGETAGDGERGEKSEHATPRAGGERPGDLIESRVIHVASPRT